VPHGGCRHRCLRAREGVPVRVVRRTHADGDQRGAAPALRRHVRHLRDEREADLAPAPRSDSLGALHARGPGTARERGAVAPEHSVKRHLVLLAVVAGGVFAFDQWTKAWATANLQSRPPVEILGTLVQFTYTRNSGVAFGLGAGTNFPFYLFSIA